MCMYTYVHRVIRLHTEKDKEQLSYRVLFFIERGRPRSLIVTSVIAEYTRTSVEMPYYGVANGRKTGVYDNWEDCKDQVNGYSHNNYKKFDTPDQAWDFVDQHSTNRNVQRFDANKAIAYRNDNQVAIKNSYQGEVSGYQRTDYMQGRNTTVLRERSYRSGTDGNGYYVEKYTRTYWKKN